MSPIDLDVVPGLDTTAIRSRGTVVTAPPFARRPFFKGGKLFRPAIALILSREAPPGKSAGILYNTYSRISRNLKEFRSGAIRVGDQEL
jgi:hypothetical protein